MIQDLLRYNIWANTRLIEVLQSIPGSQLHEPSGGSFGSIAATVCHIWGAEAIWLHRLGQDTALPLDSSERTVDPEGQWAHRWLACSADLLAWWKQNDGDVQIAYKRLNGEPQEEAAGPILAHVVNHGTFHRGQVMHCIRSANPKLPLPSLDLIMFYRSLSSN